MEERKNPSFPCLFASPICAEPLAGLFFLELRGQLGYDIHQKKKIDNNVSKK